MSDRGLFAAGGVWHPGPRSQRAGHGKSLDQAWDINSPGGTGTPVRAFLKGIITKVADLGNSSYGKYIKMNHPAAGLQSLYAHLSAQLVRTGQRVARGQVIGREGSTGGSTGPHLHFELGGGQSAISSFAGVSTSGTAQANAMGIFDKIKGWTDKLSDMGPWGDLISGIPKWIGKKLTSFMNIFSIGRADNSLGAKLPGGSGVNRFRETVQMVLRDLGQPAGLTNLVLRRMNQESGGRIRAVNNWDSNAAAGYPSTGLMQVIRPTYQSYKPRPDNGPYLNGVSIDPYSNIFAGLNYAARNYSSLAYAMGKPGGYKNGGWMMPGQIGVNETRTPEPVFSHSQWATLRAAVKPYMSGRRMDAAAAGRGSLVGLRIEGRLQSDPKTGEQFMRGVVREELASEQKYRHAMASR